MGDERSAVAVASPRAQIAIAEATEPDTVPLPDMLGPWRSHGAVPFEVQYLQRGALAARLSAKPLTDYFSRSLREE